MVHKKHLLLALLFVGLGNLIQAQTNLDFEQWVGTRNGDKPVGWFAYDDNLPSDADETVQEITDGDQAEGSSSARLTTVVYNGQLIPGYLRQGVSYSQRPEIFSFDLKHDINANDTGWVEVFFYKNGQAMGVSQTFIPGGGGAAQDWQKIVREIGYVDTTTVPDSVVFRAYSSYTGQATAVEGSEISIDDISFCPKGAQDSTVSFCNDNSELNLLTQLSEVRITGGSWIDVDSTGALEGDTLDLSQISGGEYEFKYIVDLSTCDPDTATLTLNLTDAPAAGEGGSVTACYENDSVDLFDKLQGNPDTGGQWSDNDNTGALTNGILDATSLTLGESYSFTYTNANDSGCIDSAVLNVNITESNAGNDTTVITCESNTSFDLVSRLGGNPDLGGSWTADGTNALNDSTVDLTQLQANSTYDFIYAVSTNGCEPDSATLTIDTEPALNPGESNTISACYNDTVNLFNVLGGNPETGGTWENADGVERDSIFDVSTVQDNMVHEFIYTLESQSGCEVSATVTVEVTQEPDAGEDNFGGVVCETNDSVYLVDLLEGDPVSTGSWRDDENTGAIDMSAGILDATMLNSDSSYTFTYLVTDSCGPDDSAELTLNIEKAPDAGEDSDTVEVCNTDNAVDLFAHLGGSPEEDGSWTDLDNSGGLSNGEFNPSAVDSGVFRFRFRVNANQCANAEAIVTVEVEDCNGDWIADQANKVDLKVYPNPAQNQVTFETEDNRASEIRIFDAKGGVVHQKSFDSDKVGVNVNSWSEGLYIYHLTGKNGEVLSVDKFTIER